MVLALTLLGVGYVTKLLVRFLIWLDDADRPEETSAVPAENLKAMSGRRSAA